MKSEQTHFHTETKDHCHRAAPTKKAPGPVKFTEFYQPLKTGYFQCPLNFFRAQKTKEIL